MITCYLIGSLRNPEIPKVGQYLRTLGYDVFDDWYAAGPIADDSWRDYERARGHSYMEALHGYAAKHVFDFDFLHLNRARFGVLVLPAGKSGHLEAGYLVGQGKPVYILLESTPEKLPVNWKWVAGLYEGEGSITRNGKKGGHGLQLSVTMKDEDIIRRVQQETRRGTVEGPYDRGNPKWAPMWRWVVRKRADVLYVARGLWEELGARRQAQILKVLGEARVTPESLFTSPGPHEFRYDVMYKFARGVVESLQDLGVLLAGGYK